MGKPKPEVLFNTVTQRVADQLLPHDTEAFGLLFQLSGLVTVEIKHPNKDCKFGLLHGGKVYPTEEWAALCKFPEASFRRLFRILRTKYSLVTQKMSRYGYGIAITDSYKPSRTFPQATIDKYPWLLKSKQPKRPRVLRNEHPGCEELSILPQELNTLAQELNTLDATESAEVPSESEGYKELRAGDMIVNTTEERECEIESKPKPHSHNSSEANLRASGVPPSTDNVQLAVRIEAKACSYHDTTGNSKLHSAILSALNRGHDPKDVWQALKNTPIESIDRMRWKTLADNLPVALESMKQDREEKTRTGRMLAECLTQEQEEARQRLAAIEAARQAEEALIEDEL